MYLGVKKVLRPPSSINRIPLLSKTPDVGRGSEYTHPPFALKQRLSTVTSSKL